ncbi:MAG: helix-turn-helix domain-containing protein [Rhodobacteraceae bacterium]|nr:helix-turn-helix domain-containing protein [Paracoccaceae bacterium]
MRDTLTGSRIRERRMMAGIRQAELAREVRISASYLNLIEHNRRRIGGKLLVDIARVLGVEPSMLSEGAEAALVVTLREAAAEVGDSGAELQRADEFAGRFPGWAAVLAAAHRRGATLERTVESLADRLNHDPHLAHSLHEVLSTAAAIRSTASILAEPGEIEPEWRDRFHRNLNQDSQRLAESSKALVRYLDESDVVSGRRAVPQEEVEAFIAAHDHHFAALETEAETPRDIVAGADMLSTPAARQIARGVLNQYLDDARAMPMRAFAAEVRAAGLDPAHLAARFGCDLAAVLRRLAAMPHAVLGHDVGLVICDASGSILFRKQLADFALPRFGASCPLWPLFAALGQPMRPLRRRVSQLGRSSAMFDCFAVAQPVGRPVFDEDPLLRATMLIAPASDDAAPAGPVRQVGSSCRVCPKPECNARREPSILADGM